MLQLHIMESATADAARMPVATSVGYLLQAGASPAAQPLPGPPKPRQMYRAMLRTTRPTRPAPEVGHKRITRGNGIPSRCGGGAGRQARHDVVEAPLFPRGHRLIDA